VEREKKIKGNEGGKESGSRTMHVGWGKIQVLFYFCAFFCLILQSFSLIYSIPTKSNKIKLKSKNNNYNEHKSDIKLS